MLLINLKTSKLVGLTKLTRVINFILGSIKKLISEESSPRWVASWSIKNNLEKSVTSRMPILTLNTKLTSVKISFSNVKFLKTTLP